MLGTIGQVISDLARAALASPAQLSKRRSANAVFGFRAFPFRGGVVTNDLIDSLREDDVY